MLGFFWFNDTALAQLTGFADDVPVYTARNFRPHKYASSGYWESGATNIAVTFGIVPSRKNAPPISNQAFFGVRNL
jgi:hypothetical protein